MDNTIFYFLKVSGFIEKEKQNEFQQTVQFIFNHLPMECQSHNLALDVYISNLYHLYLIWSSESSLQKFTTSHDFELLRGAFKTLGSYNEIVSGKKAELTIFELDNHDLDINPSEI